MNLPNKITLIRIILIPFFMAAFMLGYHFFADWLVYLSAGIFVIASLTDFLDGQIARKRNMVTDMGKFLDPIADKVLVAAALFLIIGYALIPAVFGVTFVAVIIAREFMVSALRQVAATKGTVIAADKIGKWKTAVTMVALTVILIARPLDVLFYGPSLLSTPFIAMDILPPLQTSSKFIYGIHLFHTFGATQWVGFSLLAAAVLLTLISGIHYLIKNRGVFAEKNEKQ